MFCISIQARVSIHNFKVRHIPLDAVFDRRNVNSGIRRALGLLPSLGFELLEFGDVPFAENAD
jgi:hypothetical protein